MNDKKQKNPITRFFQNKRAMFQSLQEMGFERGEKRLREILASENAEFNYPIPPFALMLLVWIFIIIFPIALILDPGSYATESVNMRGLIAFYLPLILTFLIFEINQIYLVPRFVFKKRYALYFIHNSLLIFISLFIREVVYFLFDSTPADNWKTFFSSYCFSFFKGHFSIWTIASFVLLVSMVCTICVIFHIIARQLVKAFVLREQTRNKLQYELDFLKNQLSPHFLFNTLNNISALIQIDPKRAESSMAKLSSLLRITLYQTSDKFIPISEDIEILKKYADLERLRLDESYDLKFNIDVEDPTFKMPPLLLMPLVENAIKHSINPLGQSFADISITQKGSTVTFVSKNSNFPRKSSSKASGLGLATFKKRMDLLYFENYEWTSEIKDDVYINTVIIGPCLTVN